MLSPPLEMKPLSILAKASEGEKLNFCRSVLFHMKTRVGLKYLVNDCGCSHTDMDGFIPATASSR